MSIDTHRISQKTCQKQIFYRFANSIKTLINEQKVSRKTQKFPSILH